MSGRTPGPAPEEDPADAAATAPVITVLRGRPTPAQLAALTAVSTAAGGGSGPDAPPRTLWTNRSRYARPRPSVGADGWRASALPR